MELRYGPMNVPANREKAFLDFFNVGHIEGLHILVQRAPPEYRQQAIQNMANWVAEYRRTLTPQEKASLAAYLNSETSRVTLDRATASTCPRCDSAITAPSSRNSATWPKRASRETESPHGFLIELVDGHHRHSGGIASASLGQGKRLAQSTACLSNASNRGRAEPTSRTTTAPRLRPVPSLNTNPAPISRASPHIQNRRFSMPADCTFFAAEQTSYE
jgi:hypothetical protein